MREKSPFQISVEQEKQMQIVQACDSGQPYVEHSKKSLTAEAFHDAVMSLLKLEETYSNKPSIIKGNNEMRIAIPIAQGKLSLHFGHCEQFALIDVDGSNRKIINREDETPPAHQPGVLPRWLSENNVNVIIAGGMGQRAQQLFTQNHIKVVVGASTGSPEELVMAYLHDKLETGDNICDH